MPGQVYERLTLSGSLPNASGLSLSVLRTLDHNEKGVHGEQSFRCCQCGLSFRRSQVRFFRGKAYGVPCTDAQDIAQLAKRGKR